MFIKKKSIKMITTKNIILHNIWSASIQNIDQISSEVQVSILRDLALHVDDDSNSADETKTTNKKAFH